LIVHLLFISETIHEYITDYAFIVHKSVYWVYGLLCTQ